MLTYPSTLQTYVAVGSMVHSLSWKRGQQLVLPVVCSYLVDVCMAPIYLFSPGSQLSCLPPFSPFLVPNPFLGINCPTFNPCVTLSLSRRHISLHFKDLLGPDMIQEKRLAESEPNFQPLTPTSKAKQPKRGQFTLKRKKSKAELDFEDMVCPLASPQQQQ